ncbi:MAG: GNAT family N-acetyltransferase [Luteimonas sp.]
MDHEDVRAGLGYEVTFGALPEAPLAAGSLREAWLELEGRSNCSFFQSWQWIGTWLALICPARIARLLSVHHGGRLIALGVITRRSRFFGLAPASLRLHETGSRTLDSLTIEYNGLLSETGHEHGALVATIQYLLTHEAHWLTLFVPGMVVNTIPVDGIATLPVGMRLRTRATHYVDLDVLRDTGSAYLPSVSSKTRSAVRRTARKFEETLGEITLTVAQDPQQRMVFFHALVDLHQAHWQDKTDGDGAFGDPGVLRFHEHLLAAANDDQGAQLIRLSAGSRPIGYVYNFISRGIVYFYQSGIDYKAATFHGSPGLLLLAHVIQYNADAGMHRFEFMAGESAYKRTLGAAAGSMAWVSIDRIGVAARLRRAWWRLKRRGT